MKRRFISVLLSLGLVFSAEQANCGPAEDYETGRKASAMGDIPTAMLELKKAADQNHAQTQVLLGTLLDRTGEHESALLYFRKAADLGDSEGEFELGHMYAKGAGIDRNFAEAMTWYKRAAEKNYAPAVTALADIYMFGGLGLTQVERNDTTESTRWIVAAAKNEHVAAIKFLADRSINNGAGGGQDAEALVWVRKAAEGGHLPAVAALAKAYKTGGPWGVAADAEEAGKWEAKLKASEKRKSRRR